MLIENVTIGADPELFIFNTKTNKVVSSLGLIPGKKNKPYRPKGMKKGYGIETDNILAEFNIPPSKTKDEFVYSIEYMKDYIDNYVKKKNPDLSIKCAASMDVDDDQLDNDEAKLFGCDPDYCVYTESENQKPEGEHTNMRSSGFHIHIGYKRANINTSLALVRLMDIYLGIPSVLYDNDKRRRELYGKAGCFRLTGYGFEYRTLSGAMLATTKLVEFVWYQIMQALYMFNRALVPSLPQEDVRNCINNSDVEQANRMCKIYNLICK